MNQVIFGVGVERMVREIRKAGQAKWQSALFQQLSQTEDPRRMRSTMRDRRLNALTPKQAFAQYAATGCFGRILYASEQNQLDRVLELCGAVGPEFVAKVAIYAGPVLHEGHAALLCAWLSRPRAASA